MKPPPIFNINPYVSDSNPVIGRKLIIIRIIPDDTTNIEKPR